MAKKSLHVLEINEGVSLDGKHLNGVREFQYKQKEGEQIGTLTLKMDVRILKSRECEERNSFLDKRRDGADSHI